MRFVADESCDHRVVTTLRDAGHDVLAIAETSRGSPDRDVLVLARRKRWGLITENRDFGQLVVAGGQPGNVGVLFNEGADFLKIDRSTALELAHSGTLPGAKVGQACVFMEDELIAYLRDMTRKQTQARRAEAESALIINRAQQEPRPKPRGRRRPLPDLPELGGQIASS
jgi:predicted nuclease of predicted toxin-antitoxin system